MTVRWRSRLLLFAVVAALALWFRWFAVYQVDDAYIVYRYAENVARGAGFVFNPGERVEGVTCFLWTLALAPFVAAGLPLPAVAPVLTALCGIGVILLLPGVSARLGGRRGADGSPAPDAWDVAAAVLAAAHTTLAYWSVGALETIPHTLLVVLALRDHRREMETGRGSRSAVWMGLGTLVRPETPLLALALAFDRMLPAAAAKARRANAGPEKVGARLRRAAAWLGVVAVFYLPFLAFRRAYFGAWVPNTYFARTGDGLAHQIGEGWNYTLRFLSLLGPGFGAVLPWSAAVGVLLLILCVAFALPRPGLRCAGLLLCALTAAVVLEGGDWMVLSRFFTTGLVLLMALLATMARAAVTVAPRARPALHLFVALLLASYVVSGTQARSGPNGLEVNGVGYRHAHETVGRFLRDRGAPEDTVALMDIGLIGYLSGLRVLDISGLTEPAVARSPGGFLRKDYPADLVLSRRPRFIVLVDGFRIDARIAEHPDFKAHYDSVMERNHRFNWTPPGTYILHVFERRETAS